jgi:hypothetical protein
VIHYSVWFNLKDSIEEAEGLATIRAFLDELYSAGDVGGFQLLRNKGTGGRTRMLPFQALIEFCDGAQFSAAFSAQAARGIHTGLHGRVMALVNEFQIEVFQQIFDSGSESATEPTLQYACEV